MKKHIVFLGAGPAGYVGALYASSMGAKATVIEKASLGGTCLNKGCIPTKTLITAAGILEKIKKAKEFGIEAEKINFDFLKLQQKKEKVVSLLGKGIEFLFKKKGINYIKGRGRFIEPKKILVEDQEKNYREVISADEVILATGSVSFIPDLFPYDGKVILTSDDILQLKEVPESLCIVGGGVIGLEMAYLFSNFGTEVTIIEMMPGIAPGLDEDISKTLERELKKKKITIYTSKKVEKIEVKDNKAVIYHNEGSFNAQKVLVAVGRKANLSGIDVEKSGFELKNGCIKVDGFMKTNLPFTWAAGDLIGHPWLAHAASYEAEVAVNNIIGNEVRVDFSSIPSCIFTYPEVACVGITEDQVKQKNINYKTGRFDFRALGKAHAQDEIEGFVKIIFDLKTEHIIGAHIIGPSASSIISECTLAIKHKIKIKDFVDYVRAHPTLPEAVKEAASSGIGIPLHS